MNHYYSMVPVLNAALNAALAPVLNVAFVPVLNVAFVPVLNVALAPVLNAALAPVMVLTDSIRLNKDLNPLQEHE